jgi:hypothetical protein
MPISPITNGIGIGIGIGGIDIGGIGIGGIGIFTSLHVALRGHLKRL